VCSPVRMVEVFSDSTIIAKVLGSDISINDLLQAEGQAFHARKSTSLKLMNRKEWRMVVIQMLIRFRKHSSK
jgi:hypothetical protein